MKYYLLILLFLLPFFFWSCNPKPNFQQDWRAQIDLGEKVLPFNFSLVQENGKWIAHFRNGSEILTMDEVVIDGDSIHISMGIFDAFLHAKLDNNLLSGVYYRKFAGDYYLPFNAAPGSERFIRSVGESKDFSGKWKVIFNEPDGSTFNAIGIFEQAGQSLTGTFRTETGDYRFLEGNAFGEEMKLSVFDGSHVFLFEATMRPDGTLIGGFWSGKHYYATWTAERSEDFELTDPDSLTYLKEGFDQLTFTFLNLADDSVSLSDYFGRPTIVQLLGSWCPNCMDETMFLVDWLKDHPESNLQVIGLAFEYKDYEYAKARVSKLKEKLNIPYEILISGSESKIEAAKALPMLNKVVSFPTLIFLNKDHEIIRIHTGFNGPSTGALYAEFIEDFEKTVEKID
ncbi:MAG: thiol-disulfide isomerase/thioredoxin [Marinoscillum sp.]|jgi:thiol-disulfide isomerase/thioredoxin